MRPRKRRVGNRQPALRDFTIPLVMTAIMLVMGIVFGSVGAQTLDQREKGELIEYLSRFGQSLADSISGARVPIQSAILTNLQKLAIIWVLAATVIGSPAILLVISCRDLLGIHRGHTGGGVVDQRAGTCACVHSPAQPLRRLCLGPLRFCGSRTRLVDRTIDRGIGFSAVLETAPVVFSDLLALFHLARACSCRRVTGIAVSRQESGSPRVLTPHPAPL